MLSAIAIYDITNDTPTANIYLRNNYAEKDKLTLFTASPLSYLEKSILPKLDCTNNGKLFDCILNDEIRYYVCKQSEDSFLMAICSERELQGTEVYHLFANMRHAHLRPHVVTLKQIISNPLGYTGKDKFLDKTQSEIEEVKSIMLSNIDKVLSRQEKLEELIAATTKLELESRKFRSQAEKLNKPCCGMV